jgi:hypothetical protein
MNDKMIAIFEKIESFSTLTKGAYSDLQASRSSIDTSIKIVRGIFDSLGILPNGVDVDAVVLRYEGVTVNVDIDGEILLFDGKADIIYDGTDVGEVLRVIVSRLTP